MIFHEGKQLIEKSTFNNFGENRYIFNPLSRKNSSFNSLSENKFIKICRLNSELEYMGVQFFDGSEYFNHINESIKILEQLGFLGKEYLATMYYQGLMDYAGLDYDTVLILTNDAIANAIYCLSESNYTDHMFHAESIWKNKIARMAKLADITHGLDCAINCSNVTLAKEYLLVIHSFYSFLAYCTPFQKILNIRLSELQQKLGILNMNAEIKKRLSIKYNFKIVDISPRITKIYSKYDIWKIAVCNSNRIQLFHRNAGYNENYHIQTEFKERYTKLPYILNFIYEHDEYVNKNRRKQH